MGTDEFQLNEPPFVQVAPNTTLLDKSDFAMMTKLSSCETETRSKKNPSSNIVNIITNRQKGQFSGNTKCNIYNRYIPNKFDILVGYPGRIFFSRLTKDGQHFITISDDKKLKIYNSGNGSYNIEKSMDIKHKRKIITDLNCSSDNEHAVYSTLSPIVILFKLADGYNEQFPLVLDDKRSRVGISSLSFSVDGRELFCGSDNGTVYIYDLKSNRRTLKFLGHHHDVTSVTFADDNILYTASIDGIVKLWDRRISSVNSPTPVGYFAGHKREIMYMDPRGDGRHLITHSNDETIKLWDIRVLSSAEVAKEWSQIVIDSFKEDDEGRDSPVRERTKPTEFKGDTSIMTYMGHSVGDSKMTCRFSPVETTGQRYIYTGCCSGRVVVYDALTGEAVQHQVGHYLCAKDVSWHPTRNEILTSGMDGLVGIWKYMDPNNVMEPKQLEIDRKHFSSFKFQNGLLLNPVRRCNVEM